MHLPSSVAELHARLGKPADWWPLLGEEQATRQECLSLLRTTATKSGYHLVTPFRQRWQAKVSARGKQRSLGVFDSPEDAAFEVLLFHTLGRESRQPRQRSHATREAKAGGPTAGMA